MGEFNYGFLQGCLQGVPFRVLQRCLLWVPFKVHLRVSPRISRRVLQRFLSWVPVRVGEIIGTGPGANYIETIRDIVTTSSDPSYTAPTEEIGA